MALYPPAVKKLIPPGSSDPKIIAVGVILHVDAGNSSSLYTYFATKSGGIESHFHIRKDGTLDQYRDTAYEADANYKGNSWIGSDGKRYGFISVETQGFEMGEWTAAQLASIKKLLTWASQTHDFPLRVAPAWNSPGVGYHVMFGAPGPWTPVAKSCPGPDRIKQFKNIIVPWMKGEEEDMALSAEDKTWIANTIDAKIKALGQTEVVQGLATKAGWLSPGSAAYARDKLGWKDAADPTKARAVAHRYLLELTFATIDQMWKKSAALEALVAQIAAAGANELTEEKVRQLLTEAVIDVNVTIDTGE